MQLANLDVIFVSNALANGGAARVISVLAREFSQRGIRTGVAIFNSFKGEYALPDSVSKEYGPSGNSKKPRSSELPGCAMLPSAILRRPSSHLNTSSTCRRLLHVPVYRIKS